MNMDSIYGSYLKASDVRHDLVVTIKSIDIEIMGRGKDAEQKPILYFHETEKGLALNVTNKNTIKSYYGAESDAWIGRRITLFATMVDFAGEQVEAIRIRPIGSAPSSHAGPSLGDALKTAKAAAWKQWQENHADQSVQQLQAGIKTALAAYFPGRDSNSLGLTEWQDFAANNFVRPNGQSDPFDAPGTGIDPADIPF